MRIKLLAASFAILFAQAVASAAPAPAPVPVPMIPAGPWNVEFADSMCLLSRPYGQDGATRLIFKPGMVGDDLELIVTKATSDIGDIVDGKVVLSINGKPLLADSYFTAYSTKQARVLRIWNKEDAIALSAIRGTVKIDTKAAGRHYFAIPGIDQALPVLSRCLDQLRTAYKVSKSDLAAIATKPDGRIFRYFTTADYPSEALSNDQAGTVGVLFWVETTGRVSTCEVIETSAAPILGKTTCDILIKRARLTPAKDAEGRAIRAPVFSRIRWELATF